MSDEIEQNDKQDSQKSKLLKGFEKDNQDCFKYNEKGFKQIDINRSAFDGHLWVDGDGVVENEKKAMVNIIKSNITSYLPHIFAKRPTPSIKPSEKVAPVDGDEKGDIYTNALVFAETARLVVQRVLDRAKIKKRAQKAIKSKLIDAAGIMKVSYQKDFRENLTVTQEITSTQKQFFRAEVLRLNVEKDGPEFQKMMQSVIDGTYERGSSDDSDGEFEKYMDTMKGLNERKTDIISQGINLSVLPLKHCRWDRSVPLEDVHDGRFFSHFIFETNNDTKAKYNIQEGEDKERTKKWTTHQGLDDESSEKNFIKIWERWDSETGLVYTWVEGDKEFLKEPFVPAMIEDVFFPFFPLVSESSGSNKLPPSMVEDLIPMAKQYEQDTKDKIKHRGAAIPSIMFDKGKVNAKDFNADIKNVGVRDFIGIDTNGQPMSDLFAPAPTVPLNERLYARDDLLFDMQNTTGLQDAERGAITKAKTLGEAQIMQSGLANRTEDARDLNEVWFSMIYRYSLMLIIKEMPKSEVIRIAGENAVWADADESLENLYSLVDVDIEVGSTGRPNKQMEQKSWFENLENLTGVITQVMTMRKQGVKDTDNPFYRMLEETFRRLDERIDIASIMPKGEVITSGDLIQSVTQQVEQLAEKDPNAANIAQQFLMSNPLVNKLIQTQQQEAQQNA